MKKLSPVITAFILVLTGSCGKIKDLISPLPPCDCSFLNESLTDPSFQGDSDTLANYYKEQWKAYFLAKNQITESVFQEKIKEVKVQTLHYEGNSIFWVYYIYENGWVKTRKNDNFWVKISAKEGAIAIAYRNTPRERFLIGKEIPFDYIGTHISSIDFKAKLAFASCEEACKALRRKTGYRMLNPREVTFNYPGSGNGDTVPYMVAWGTISEKKNQCVMGKINLTTGQASAYENVCIIYN